MNTDFRETGERKNTDEEGFELLINAKGKGTEESKKWGQD